MDIKSNKILITGSFGFIGSHLIELFNSMGLTCVGYDLKKGEDIRNRVKLDYLFETETFDTVIHLAALTGARRGNDFFDDYVSTNINGTRNIIEMCEKWSVNNFIFFSSSSVLGGNKKDSRGEYVGLREDAEYNPLSVYGMTKVAGEILTKNSKIKNWAIVRPFTVYGHNPRKDMVIYKWINQIKKGLPITMYGNGESVRGYTYVEDLIKAIYSLSTSTDNKDIWRKIYHIGGEERITLNSLHEMFRKKFKEYDINIKNEKIDRKESDPDSSFADSTLAKELIHFRPSLLFKENLFRIIDEEMQMTHLNVF